jgi:hypothetical protein
MKPAARVLPFLVLLFWSANASAQGFHYNVYVDGTYVGALDEGYPYDGVSCDSITIWNELNGAYLSGGAVYPSAAALTNFLSFYPPGDYSWTLGFDIVVPDPLGGCSSSSSSFTLPIGVGVSATNYVFDEQVGNTCFYQPQDCGDVVPTCGAAQGFISATSSTPCYLYYLQQFGSIIFDGGARRCYALAYIPPNYFSGGQNVPVACN